MNKFTLFCFLILVLKLLTAAEPEYYSLSNVPARIACDLRQNNVYELILEENPTTGYCWNVIYDKKLCAVKTDYLVPQNGMCGAPGKLKISITSQSSRRFCVIMDYSRPWEKNVKPFKRINLEFNKNNKNK